MARIGWIWVLSILVVSAAFSCGDDDADPGGSGALSAKALENLTADDVEEMCARLIGVVRDASSPERQCVDLALDGADTEAECNSARARCLSDELYVDYDDARCASWTSSTVPSFDCDTKVSEVEACYGRVADWLEDLRCAQAGDSPEVPQCIRELGSDCDFRFSVLIGEGSDGMDGGMSCEPGTTVSCECSSGGRGTQICNASGEYGTCSCGSAPSEYECRDGNERLPYDIDFGDDCNACATENCCDSFVDCQNDADCRCYFDCWNRADEGCLETCNIADDPTQFSDHAVCLVDKCRVPCGLSE